MVSLKRNSGAASVGYCETVSFYKPLCCLWKLVTAKMVSFFRFGFKFLLNDQVFFLFLTSLLSTINKQNSNQNAHKIYLNYF